MADHDLQEIRERISVCADGTLIWKPVPLKYVKDARAQKIFNTRYSGKLASTQRADGRFVDSIRGRKVFSHRVVFALVHGFWPLGEIDHINGDHTDNRPCNLRDVSKSGNMRNQKRSAKNTSGSTGVHMQRGKWRAYIQEGGKSAHLGFFACKTAAAISRKQAEIARGYHPNHGRASS